MDIKNTSHTTKTHTRAKAHSHTTHAHKQSNASRVFSLTQSLFVLALCASMLFLGACAPHTIQSTDKIQYFDSQAQLDEYLNSNQASYASNTVKYRLSATSDLAMGAPMPAMAESAADDGAGSGAANLGSDYSTTNVQVKGVDEADIIKTDGNYIYLLSGTSFVIIDAKATDVGADTKNDDKESGAIVSEVVLKGTPQNIFLNENRVVIFQYVDDQKMTWPEYSMIPIPEYRSATEALVYDVSDKEKPELLETIKMTGNYNQARMIGDQIYVITNDWPNRFLPMIKTSSTTIQPRVAYFDNYEDNYQYTIVTTFDTNGKHVDAQTYLTGYTNTVYMSEDALYIAYQKNQQRFENQRDEFFSVVLPALPSSLEFKIRGIRTRNIDDEEKWTRVLEEFENYMNDLSDKEKEQVYEDIQNAIATYQEEQAAKQSRTIIHKIDLDLDYVAQGEVAGQLLNQFSLDENQGNLRIATTVSTWTNKGSVQYNNVYVLDKNLEQIGALEHIAPDERIYSTRFMNDRLYMVTFKQVDPFFVIDLKDPKNPEILGMLKIPGWSEYLHPYDENYVIGFGRTTQDSEWGTRTGGLKLSLFDVRDVEHPKEVDTYVIGQAGSYSEALNDHKAFLFDKEKELLVIPVQESSDYRSYWQGAYVFTVTNKGFEKRGTIAHYTGSDWWGYTSAVRRSLYIDNTLYTMSNTVLKLNNLDTLKTINTIALPNSQRDYYPRPYYGGVMYAEDAVAIDSEVQGVAVNPAADDSNSMVE